MKNTKHTQKKGTAPEETPAKTTTTTGEEPNLISNPRQQGENTAEENPGISEEEALEEGSQGNQSEESISEESVEEESVSGDSIEEEPVCEESGGAELEARLAEAERRGYLRGRNERIEELMREPGVFERGTPRGEERGPESAEPLILNNPRISIWDR